MNLKHIKSEYSLTVRQLAMMMGCSIEQTRSYLYRDIEVPEYRQRLLTFELERLKKGESCNL